MNSSFPVCTKEKLMETGTERMIVGYNLGKDPGVKSSVSMEELEELKQTLSLSGDDITYLHMAGYALESQTDDIINAWRGVIAASHHLAYYFTASNKQADNRYKALVKERFKQWVLDVCFKPYDQE